MKISCLLIWIIWGMLAGEVRGQESYRIVSYNVENLFDTADDPNTLDDDFTPLGKQHWTAERYNSKILKIGKVLEAVGEGTLPAFIGLCEVENRVVLTDLITKSSLNRGNYAIAHKDSPDDRGIDVALLYDRSCFRLLGQDFIFVNFPEDSLLFTRDILYVSGILADQDTLHFFVCHFPSMFGGETASEWKRERAARLLKVRIDSIQEENPGSAIIVMGDLNGRADRPAQSKVLGTINPDTGQWEDTGLYNTGYYLLKEKYGSYKYRGKWQTLDHIIVSGALLNGSGHFRADRHLVPYFVPFLLEEEKTGNAYKPFRTYSGTIYRGGYSDHLPVYLDLKK